MDKTQEIGNKIKSLMDQNGISQRELAKKIQISEAAISYLINGQRIPRIETIEAIALALNTDVSYLLGNDNKSDDKIIKVPVFRNIKGNDSLDLSNKSYEYIIPVALSRYKSCRHLFGKIVVNEEMNPRIMKNDVILFDSFNFTSDKISNGDICLISKGTDDAVIREVAILDNVLCFNLFNVTMPPRLYTTDDMRRENITIIGKAVTLVHDFREL